jgi:Heterokaryon incompatibility protein (HET)
MQNYHPILPSLPKESDGFRIFELLQPRINTSSEEIHGNFHSARLSSHVEYEALSYCWGDPTRKHSIQIDGKPFPVTDNLYYSLRHLRHQDQSRYLWIDAICIDQQDFDERSHQVGLMRYIYNEARHVVVWLGAEAGNSRAGMTLAEQLLRAYHQRESTRDSRMYQHLQDLGISAVYDLPEFYGGDRYRAFFQIFNRPWFERGWVIQEVATAKRVTVQCGSSVLGFEDLLLCLGYLNDMDMTSLIGQSNIVRLIRIGLTRQAFQRGQAQSLLVLLTRHSDIRTTDPRDRIYALSGMSLNTTIDQTTDERPGLDIKADYRADVEDVYRSFVVELITKTRSLDVLFTPRDPNCVSDLLLPSWVPDFTLPYHQIFLLGGPGSKSMAAGASKCHPSFDIVHDMTRNRNQHLLGVSGIIFDTVVAISDYWPFEPQEDIDDDDSEIASMASKLLSSCRIYLEIRWRYIQSHEVARLSPWPWRARPKLYVTGEPLEEALWAICIAGNTSQSSPAAAKSTRSLSYKSWRHDFRRYGLLRLLPFTALQYFFLIIGLVLKSLGLFLCGCCCLCCVPGYFRPKGHWHNLMTGLAGRRLLRTRSCWIGVAGGDLAIGDRLALLEGGGAVAVVRDTKSDLVKEGNNETVVADAEEGGDDGQRLWTLAGDAHVHGVMDGRLYKTERCRKIWLC